MRIIARREASGESHQPGSGLPQEGLEVSSGHQLQQDEPGHGLQADADAPHDVLVVELTAGSPTAGKQALETHSLALER